jgi:hypothetical protein
MGLNGAMLVLSCSQLPTQQLLCPDQQEEEEE